MTRPDLDNPPEEARRTLTTEDGNAIYRQGHADGAAFARVELDRLSAEVSALKALLTEARREHAVDQDNFPLCAQLLDGTDPDARCDCGAGEWNARIDAAIKGAE